MHGMHGMLVLGIDPGPEKSAWVQWDSSTERIIACDVWPNPTVQALIDHARAKQELVAIEAVTCYGLPAGKNTFGTCYWIGRFDHVRDGWRPCLLVPYREISRHLCKVSSARSAQIYAALRERFGPPGTKAGQGVLYPVSKNEHLRSALALAVYVADTSTAGE